MTPVLKAGAKIDTSSVDTICEGLETEVDYRKPGCRNLKKSSQFVIFLDFNGWKTGAILTGGKLERFELWTKP
ncbi:hypothetical protein HUJ05_001551 [Dendroctonus ponderosae]|nr:hypothetical protein HUJ05_001551 [Dendroctonus ponderosae]